MRKMIIILAALILTLAVACSPNSGEKTAEIRVRGTYESPQRRNIETENVFSSGKIEVNGEDITANLAPVDSATTLPANKNGVEFKAVVVDLPTTIDLTVTPKTGFVFDEWELDKTQLRNDLKAKKITLKKIRELDTLLEDGKENNETLTVNAEDAKYFIATFEHGYYVDSNYNKEESDGSKEKPFGSIEKAIRSLTDFNDDELTFKLASSGIYYDFSTFNKSRLEEIKILGSYDAKTWNVNNNNNDSPIGDLTSLINSADEIELRNVNVNSLNLIQLNNVEIEFSNVKVDNLTVSDSNPVANIIVTDEGVVTGSTTFINSVVPYGENLTYYHCVVVFNRGNLNNSEIKLNGKNNILVYPEASNEPNKIDGNIWIKETEFAGNRYMLKNYSNMDLVKSATPLAEIENIDDDYLEEDILSRERAEADEDAKLKVSYGPYEYNDYE